MFKPTELRKWKSYLGSIYHDRSTLVQAIPFAGLTKDRTTQSPTQLLSAVAEFQTSRWTASNQSAYSIDLERSKSVLEEERW